MSCAANNKKSVKLKCFEKNLVIVLIKQINKQKYLLLLLLRQTKKRPILYYQSRNKKQNHKKMINSLTTLESHLFKITSHHFRITSFQLNVISRREKNTFTAEEKLRKSSNFIMKNKQKNCYFRIKPTKKTKKKTYRKRAKAQKPTRFYG